MYFLAMGTITGPTGLAALQDEEDQTLQELRSEGTVVQAFRRAEGHGVVGILQGPDLETVSRQMNRLPFVDHHLLHFEYSEIVNL